MSELVSRVRELTARISELEDDLLAEKRKYADEIDNADNLAYLLTLVHNGANCPPSCSFCDGIRMHERRRAMDYGLIGVDNEPTT